HALEEGQTKLKETEHQLTEAREGTNRLQGEREKLRQQLEAIQKEKAALTTRLTAAEAGREAAGAAQVELVELRRQLAQADQRRQRLGKMGASHTVAQEQLVAREKERAEWGLRFTQVEKELEQARARLAEIEPFKDQLKAANEAALDRDQVSSKLAKAEADL